MSAMRLKLLPWLHALACLLLAGPVAAAAPPAVTFLVGPYPSKGLLEYALEYGAWRQATPGATDWSLCVERDGQVILRESHKLAPEGHAQGIVDVGKMPDGAHYTVAALITDPAGHELARQTTTFARTIMPFETAPPAGTADLIVPPFTAPVLGRQSVSCWGRTYRHGTGGLLEQLTAAGQDLLARPCVLRAQVKGEPLTTLQGSRPLLAPAGQTAATLDQTFSGAGIRVVLHGDFDYDGFYKFTALLAPQDGPVELEDLRLEIPFKASIAQLIEAAVTWRRIEGTPKECMGELDTRQGVLWDSQTYPSRNWPRIGNMPPFFWLGDDQRGLVYSCASEQGMHNDEHRPAAQLERRGPEVLYTAWFANQPLHLADPRTFAFALQASPFKALPEHARLWRNQGYRMPYRNGTLFTNWFTAGSYPTYGRFLTLDRLKQCAAATGADQVGVMASAGSECGGTPEYLQFWHEWGSDLAWNTAPRDAPEPWAVQMLQEAGVPPSPKVRVESASNVCASNVAYRTWWFDQELRHAGISYIYQDNPPYVTTYDPPNGYGYVRDDGRPEPTSAIWNSRTFAKRCATAAVAAGRADSPYLWVNTISPVLPGRSFARKMLNGEYLYTKLLTLGQYRVMASKQWGMVLDWYPFPQTPESPYPNPGPVRKYWRSVYSRLLLHDVTSFSGGDNAEFARRWLDALDLFWLDDAGVQWHPYYRNDTLAAPDRPATLVSTYTAPGRLLALISNQGPAAIAHVRFRDLASFGCGGLKYFYDAETGEAIETAADGTLELWIPQEDYRVVLGYPAPWAPAAIAPPGRAALPAASTLDPELTLTAISRQLLTAPTLHALPGAHPLYQQWMEQVLAELPASGPDVVYLDAKACADVAFGKPGIQAALLYSKKLDALLVAYVNDSDQDVALPATIRDQLAAKAGKRGHNFVIHPVYGHSEWEFIDLPAHEGLLEICYSDSVDFWGARHGPFQTGTMLGNITRAVEANQRSRGGRALPR